MFAEMILGTLQNVNPLEDPQFRSAYPKAREGLKQ